MFTRKDPLLDQAMRGQLAPWEPESALALCSPREGEWWPYHWMIPTCQRAQTFHFHVVATGDGREQLQWPESLERIRCL